MPLWSAFILGFVGSLHCAGMCGPLVFALHRGGGSPWGRLSYHGGRILTYAMLGAVLGLLGFGAQLAGLQKGFSVLLGAVLVVSIIAPFVFPRINTSRLLGNVGGRLSAKVNRWMGKAIQGGTSQKQFYLGLLNGLLPCGMVYVAIAGALSMASYWQSSLYMVMFGLGTWPMLLAISMGSRLGFSFRKFNVKRLAPVFVLALGLLLIWRGLGLQLQLVVPGDPFAGITLCRTP